MEITFQSRFHGDSQQMIFGEFFDRTLHKFQHGKKTQQVENKIRKSETTQFIAKSLIVYASS